MKIRYLLILFFLIYSFSVNAQYDQSVQWEFKYNKIDEQTYELVSTAKIERLWYLYGQFFSERGPTRLSFVYDDNDNGESLELIGVTEESPEPLSFYDGIYNVDIQYFIGEAIFTQKIRFKKKTDIKVYIGGLTRNKITKMERKISAEHLFKFE